MFLGGYKGGGEEVVGGGGGPDDGGTTATATRWPPSSMEKGEGGSNQERNSKMAVVVKRLHNALAKEFFSQSCANSFSFFGTFPQTEKRVRQRQRTKERRGIDKNRIVSSSYPLRPVSIAHQPLALSPGLCRHTWTRSRQLCSPKNHGPMLRECGFSSRNFDRIYMDSRVE